MFKRGDAKEMQYGRVDKIMPEKKNRQGNENEEGNKNKASRLQGSGRATRAVFILHIRFGIAKIEGTQDFWRTISGN